MSEGVVRGHPRCVILGGGGHARVLIDTIQLEGLVEIEGILDRDSSKRGELVLEVPILGDDGLLSEMGRRGVTHFTVGLGGVGNNRPRQALFEKGLAAGLVPLTVRHPSCAISRWISARGGCQFLPGCVVNAGAELGHNIIVNSGAVVEHDCAIGDHSHIATGALLASTVSVGALAHIGAGATVKQGLIIGEAAVVGAGAVVVKNVAAGDVVVGVPAHSLALNG